MKRVTSTENRVKSPHGAKRKVSLDAVDRTILRFLINNARMPYLEIARECGISGAAIHQRIRRLEEWGVIKGSNLVVDHKAIGLDVCAYIYINMKDTSLVEQIIEQLKEIPEIAECHMITGPHMVMAKVYCTDNEHLISTLLAIQKIPGIQTTETFHSLNVVFSRPANADVCR